MEHTQAYVMRNDPRATRVSVGGLLVGIGVIHNLFGLAFGLGWLAPPDGTEGSTSIAPLVDIARAGWIGAVEPDPLRMVFFWFVMTGFALMLTGLAAHTVERAGLRLPRAFAWSVGAFCLLGIALIPASGFWLGLVPASLAWSRSTHRSR